MNAYVFFADPPVPRFTWRWLVSLVGGTHVCVGYGEVVLHPTIAGARFWPMVAFCRGFPGLSSCFTVPVTSPLKLEDFEVLAHVRQRESHRVLRWLTRGAFPMMDCTAQVSAALARAGVLIPRWVVTPRQMHRWLTLRGYRCDEA